MQRKDNRKKRQINKMKRMIRIEVAVLLVFVLVFMIFNFMNSKKETSDTNNNGTSVKGEETTDQGTGEDPLNEKDKLTEEELEQQRLEQEKLEEERRLQEAEQKRNDVLEEAKLLAMGYDYDSAIELIKAYEEDYTQYAEFVTAIEEYEATKETLSLYGAFESVDEISHVFFHSLIADNSKAFDGDGMENGYNYWMTTVSEFNKMMEKMHEAGYVLVSIHDVAHEVTLEDGSTVMKPGEIMLPPDKKPFVLSQDDVNYYEYMEYDGFAKRIVIDEAGNIACEMIVDGESVVARDFDVAPLLEKFIEEHPDFSYRGARGILALTGYEGVLGYRTNDNTSDTYEDDIKAATYVAEVLKEKGWEFASHSYGHGHMGQRSYDYVKADSDRWKREVESIIGPTDILIFPYGEDVQEGVGTYNNDKYKYLDSLGFKYYCGVYARPWIQVNDNYVRMTRRNLDGFTMHFYPERLTDLFDVPSVYDYERPQFR